MRELGAEHGLETNTTVPELLGFPGVIDVWPDTVEIWPSLRGELLGLVRQALEELVEMRRSEGQRLTHDITGRLEAIERSTEELSELAEEAKAARREQLADRAAALRAELGLDEARLYQEIAKLVDRCDVNEEVVRLRSHLIQARADGFPRARADTRGQHSGQQVLVARDGQNGGWPQERNRKAARAGSKR
jgi:uncharacterized protein (TIGR00255 family)